MIMNDDPLDSSRQVWDAEAPTFDNEPDHGLRDTVVRQAWTALLKDSLLDSPASVLDMGCGTGSLSVVMAELGYGVTGADFSPAMIALAQEKATCAGYPIAFYIMDASHPTFPSQQFDVIVCRHLLWALPDPAQVLERWINLLKPNGQLCLIEGFWHTGGGLHATQILDMLPVSMTDTIVNDLSDQSDLWGGTVNDERYLIRTRLGTSA